MQSGKFAEEIFVVMRRVVHISVEITMLEGSG